MPLLFDFGRPSARTEKKESDIIKRITKLAKARFAIVFIALAALCTWAMSAREHYRLLDEEKPRAGKSRR